MRLNKDDIRFFNGYLFATFFKVVNNTEANIPVFRQPTEDLSQARQISD